MGGFTVASFSDSHLGYNSGTKIHPPSGLNHRVRDGYLALRETVDQIIEAEVDLAVHCGDIFHRSWPQVSDIAFAQAQLRRLSVAGIPVILNTGNHDASNDRAKSPATLSLHDPDRGLHVVTGLVEVHRPVVGLTVTVLSHMGLATRERQVVTPVDGDLNLFTAHGAAAVPGHEIFHCIDSPGEQPIGLDLLGDPGWAATLLGHYHGMGPLPDLPNAWYAGSALRRGESDPAGGRGWIKVTVGNGTVDFEPRYINQRAQYDLPAFDATGLTGADVEERVRYNLAQVEVPGAIIRQVVTNCALAVKRGVDVAALNRLTAPALIWKADFRRPDAPEVVYPGDPSAPLDETAADPHRTGRVVHGAADLPGLWRAWAPGWGETLPVRTREIVLAAGERHLAAATTGVDTEQDAPVRPASVRPGPADAPADSPADSLAGTP